MSLTADEVAALAPDASSAAAGKQLGRTGAWRSLGQAPEVLWGECQGSVLYQVRVDRSDLRVACTCPSRKQPCKHGLGLLYLAAGMPDALPRADPPEWVSAWLAKRTAGAGKRETRKAAPAPAARATQGKRA